MSLILPLEALGYRFRLTVSESIFYEHQSDHLGDPVTAARLLANLNANKVDAITELQTRQALSDRDDLHFVNLHVHTDHSIFDGFQTVEEVVCRVKEFGQTSFAVTDHGTTSALYHAALAARKENIGYVPGVETYFCPDLRMVNNGISAHLVLLAMTEEGRVNLNHLVTLSFQQRYRKPLVGLRDLARFRTGLVATTACRGGILSLPDYRRNVLDLQQIFGEDLFIEIQTGVSADQVEFNKNAVELAQSLKLPIVATSDAHYTRLADADAHQKWLQLSAERGSYYADDYSLADLPTVIDRLSYLPQDNVAEAISNTAKIAERCTCSMLRTGRFYPGSGLESALDKIKERCDEGWASRNLSQLPPERQQIYRSRLADELAVLDSAGYMEYLLIVADVFDFCRSKNIRTGPGRGSAVGSLVVFLLGITSVDPVREELLFERFCHVHRISPPDIDLDVQASRRDEVLDFLRGKYPYAHQVRTINVIQDKAAIQRAGKALSIAPQLVNRLSKSVASLDSAPRRSPVAEIADREYVALVALAKSFLGRVQNFGVHASAIALFPEDPAKWCAIERQGDGYVSAFDHNELESLGLLKLDVLGLAALDTIEQTLKKLENPVNLAAVPEDDSETMKLLRSGATSGIFQMGSSGMDRLVREAEPQCRQDLVPLIALYRPGPLQSGMAEEYLRVGQSASGVAYLHPDLEPILSPTRGQIIFQEQIMKIASVLGGFDLGEADLFRRAVAKKKAEEMAAILEDFSRRCLERGYDKIMVDSLVEKLLKFADYAFNKSHSAAYSVLTYQMAYLKANNPACFLCSALNVDLGDREKAARYVAEARLLGISIQPPDMAKPLRTWWLRDKKCLVVGLGAIKGVGNVTIAANPGLSGLEYFELLRSGPAKIRANILRSLVSAGCFAQDTDSVAKILNVEVSAGSTYESFGFWMQDVLQGQQKTARLEPFEVLSARYATTKTGEPMVFATLRGSDKIVETVGFRANAKTIAVGEIVFVTMRDGVIIKAKAGKTCE